MIILVCELLLRDLTFYRLSLQNKLHMLLHSTSQFQVAVFHMSSICYVSHGFLLGKHHPAEASIVDGVVSIIVHYERAVFSTIAIMNAKSSSCIVLF